MDKTITILIYFHAFFGGVGLISGIASILFRKGGINHRKAGKIFSISMIISALISLVVAQMPGHGNIFLTLIGIFTIYLVLAGNRALTLRSRIKSKADNLDKSISGIMFLTSLVMLTLGTIGMIQQQGNAILYLFFGAFGTFMSLKDFQTFGKFTVDKNAWIKSHIGRMVGALIASITAFLVVGLNIGTVFVWIMPTILGTIYIIYSTRKFGKVAA